MSRLAGITCDSREVKPGYAFIAVRGLQQDGNDFIEEAIDRGAELVLTEQPYKTKRTRVVRVRSARETLARLAALFYNQPATDLELIGVTGTNGKTTTTSLIYNLLNYRQTQTRAGLIGTVRVDTGDKLRAGKLTTPPPVPLHRFLAEMVDNNLKYCCMEVSSHGIKLQRILGLDFSIKVGTNITRDHYDLHDSFADYIAVKKSFLNDRKALILINGDDNILINLDLSGPNLIYYGLDSKNQVTARDIHRERHQTHFQYILKQGLKAGNKTIDPCQFPVTILLPGYHNLLNALVMITIGLYEELSQGFICDFLRNFRGVWRRLQIIYNQDFTVIDDCAHNPGSYRAVFNTVEQMDYRRLIIINSLRGNRGVRINRANAETISSCLQKFKDYHLITTSCVEVVQPNDKVTAAEKNIFLKTLTAQGIIFNYHQQLYSALTEAVNHLEAGDLLLLLGPHAMDRAGELLLEMLN